MELMLFELIETGEMVAVEGEDVREGAEYLERATRMEVEFVGWTSEEEVEDMGIDTY